MSARNTCTDARRPNRASLLAIAAGVALACFGTFGGHAAFADPPGRVVVVGAGQGQQPREHVVAGTTKLINGLPTTRNCGYYYADVNDDAVIDTLDVNPFIEMQQGA